MNAEAAILIDKYEHLFAEPGWKELISDLIEKQSSLKSAIIESSMGFDQIQFYRGLIAGYKYIAMLEATVEQAKNQQTIEDLPDVIG